VLAWTGDPLDDWAVRWAAMSGHKETLQALLAAGANVHAGNDFALCVAANNGYTATVGVLAEHIFAPDSCRGESRAEIEAHAEALYAKIKASNPQPEHLRKAGFILLDYALTCWEQVRPAPPEIQISPFPAQPRRL
jgi:ankyrin repeat protein